MSTTHTRDEPEAKTPPEDATTPAMHEQARAAAAALAPMTVDEAKLFRRDFMPARTTAKS